MDGQISHPDRSSLYTECNDLAVSIVTGQYNSSLGYCSLETQLFDAIEPILVTRKRLKILLIFVS